jgi:hypothetical protein
MKYVLLIITVLSLFRCKEGKNKPEQDISSVKPEKPDTFQRLEPYTYRSLQAGILSDTIEIKATRHHTGITIIKPRVDNKNSYVNKYIDGSIKLAVSDFEETVEDDLVEQEDGIDKGFGLQIIPVCLYRDENVLSYSMQIWHSNNMGPAAYAYSIINFDIKGNKQIGFDDFFIMKTSADSAYWADIISRSTEIFKPDEAKQWLELYGPAMFSFDADKIYFFFETHDILFGRQMGSVRRKYVAAHINEKYR